MQLFKLGRQKGSGSAFGLSSSKENPAVNPTAQKEVLEERLELLQSQLDLGLLISPTNHPRLIGCATTRIGGMELNY